MVLNYKSLIYPENLHTFEDYTTHIQQVKSQENISNTKKKKPKLNDENTAC